MAAEVERYIIELGTEGRLIEMQLEETVVGVMADRAAIVRDYATEDTEQRVEETLQELADLPHEEVLDFGRLAELLGYDRKTSTVDFAVAPRGYRALSRIPRLPRLVAQRLVQRFGDLDALLAASEGELASVDGVGETRARDIREGLAKASGGRPSRPLPIDQDGGRRQVAASTTKGVPNSRGSSRGGRRSSSTRNSSPSSAPSRRATTSSIRITGPAWS